MTARFPSKNNGHTRANYGNRPPNLRTLPSRGLNAKLIKSLSERNELETVFGQVDPKFELAVVVKAVQRAGEKGRCSEMLEAPVIR